MGLPMFREPDEVAAEKAVAKLEQIAATGRSAIRRESSIRPGRAHSSRSLIERIRESRRGSPRPHESRNTDTPPPRALRDTPTELLDFQSELARMRSIRPHHRYRIHRIDVSRPTDDDEDAGAGPAAHAENPDGPIRPNGNDVTLFLEHADADFDSFLSDSPDPLAQSLPRPSRESGLRFELSPNAEPLRIHRLPRLHVARGEASRHTDGSGRAWVHIEDRDALDDSADESYENAAALTPGFAPAHAHGPVRSRSVLHDRRFQLAVDTALGLAEGLVDSTADSRESSYPPLRRVNHASSRPPSAITHRLDGLGDRRRSLSLGSDAHEEENWANLLTTIEPGRSSTATSFLSSRSDSRTGSNRSSQATTMTTSFGEIGGDDSCDLDLPSGITEEDVREIRARHGRLRRRGSPRPVDGAQDAPPRDSAPYNERLLESEIVRGILERMQRREEIPDEWWAAVGLSPEDVRGGS